MIKQGAHVGGEIGELQLRLSAFIMSRVAFSFGSEAASNLRAAIFSGLRRGAIGGAAHGNLEIKSIVIEWAADYEVLTGSIVPEGKVDTVAREIVKIVARSEKAFKVD